TGVLCSVHVILQFRHLRVLPHKGGIVAVPVEFCDRLRLSIANVLPRRDRQLSGRSSDGTVGVIDLAALDYSSCLLSQTQDRKSTRLNSSHVSISYAVFCLKKKKNI